MRHRSVQKWASNVHFTLPVSGQAGMMVCLRGSQSSTSTTPSSPYQVRISALRTPPTGPIPPFMDAPHLQEALDMIWDWLAGQVPDNHLDDALPFPLILQGAYQSIRPLYTDRRSFRSSSIEKSYYYGPPILHSLPMQNSITRVESASNVSQCCVPASFHPACTVLDPRHCIPTAVYTGDKG